LLRERKGIDHDWFILRGPGKRGGKGEHKLNVRKGHIAEKGGKKKKKRRGCKKKRNRAHEN